MVVFIFSSPSSNKAGIYGQPCKIEHIFLAFLTPIFFSLSLFLPLSPQGEAERAAEREAEAGGEDHGSV